MSIVKMGGTKGLGPGKNTRVALERSDVSRQLSRRLPYYLTLEKAHRLIDAADNELDRLFFRRLWDTGDRVSEAMAIRLGDVSREGIRVLGKVGGQ